MPPAGEKSLQTWHETSGTRSAGLDKRPAKSQFPRRLTGESSFRNPTMVPDPTLTGQHPEIFP
jgi:hypothetical protein